MNEYMKLALDIAQLLNFLLIPIALFAYRVMRHMIQVELFMKESKEDRVQLNAKVNEHDRALSRGGMLG